MAPAGYPLHPFKGKAAAFEARPSPYLGPHAKPRRDRPQPKPLAPIIDTLLLEGGRTMRGLVREVKQRAVAACRGRMCGRIFG